MAGSFSRCIGCGAEVTGVVQLCSSCKGKVELFNDRKSHFTPHKNIFIGKIEMSEEKFLKFVKSGLLVKSYLLAGVLATIVLAHPAWGVLQSAAHQICQMSSTCPLS